MPFRLCLLAALTLALGCAPPASSPGTTAPGLSAPDAVWAVDLVRTLPGAQADYIASIETNWANARADAAQGGAVITYHAFAAEPDSSRGWDVLLMTAYTDSTTWAQREATFEAIFQAPGFELVQPARPSGEMRELVASGVVMRAFVSEP